MVSVNFILQLPMTVHKYKWFLCVCCFRLVDLEIRLWDDHVRHLLGDALSIPTLKRRWRQTLVEEEAGCRLSPSHPELCKWEGSWELCWVGGRGPGLSMLLHQPILGRGLHPGRGMAMDEVAFEWRSFPEVSTSGRLVASCIPVSPSV